MQLTSAQLVLARFLFDVVRGGAAWGLCHAGELCVLHGPDQIFLPLWSRREVARRAQRRFWPELSATDVSLPDLLSHCLPPARTDGVWIGVGVGGDRGDPGLVVIPADWLERALRAGVETGWRESSAR